MGPMVAITRTASSSTRSCGPSTSLITIPAATTSSRCFSQRLTFEVLGGNQTRLIWQGTFASAEERARVINDYGADKGVVQTMARLAAYVETMAASGTKTST
jgi:hypothetical protein